MDKNNNIKLVEVFSGTQWEATMIKNLLENEQIETFVKNEIMANLYTFNTLPDGSIQVKVIVSSNDFNKSIQVINEYKKNVEEDK